MFNINPGEMVLLVVIALLVFGPERIPEVALQLGRWYREFKAAADAAGAEITRELEAVARQNAQAEADAKAKAARERAAAQAALTAPPLEDAAAEAPTDEVGRPEEIGASAADAPGDREPSRGSAEEAGTSGAPPDAAPGDDPVGTSKESAA